MRISGEVAVERVGVSRFGAIVELLPNRASEFVDDLPRVDEVERAHAFLRNACRLVQEGEVCLDLPRRSRTLHLDRDRPAVREGCAMHLADGRRRDRPLVELQEQALEREAELFLDHLLDVGEREGADVVLQAAELGDDVRRQDVRPRRQELAELHERRAELVEHLPQVLSALRRLPVDDVDARAAPREEVGQPMRVEPVAEAVPDGDLRDLRQPSEILGRGLGHRLSVTSRERGAAAASGPPAA
jgi:hypothetical protein